MKDERELELLIASRFPIIAIDTQEEARALALVARCAARRKLPLWSWSLTSGWASGPARLALTAEAASPPEALRHLSRVQAPGVWVLLDFHPFLDDPLHVRLLKEIAGDHDRVPRTVVLIGHHTEIPPEIDKLAVRFELALPDDAAVEAIVKDEIVDWQKRHARKLAGDRTSYDMLQRHLRGMVEADVRRLVRQAIEADGVLDSGDLARVVAQKHRLFGKEGLLSFELDTARFADVAGLASLKRWLERRRTPFLGVAGPAGAAPLDVPKGIMLLGVQGCGKSLAAKAVAGAWNVPLLRLDVGALYDKYIGETERKLRTALQSAEAMAPCVLWIDEIEKALSSSDGGDDGASRRVLGTLLTWMAERDAPVFIVATSNDIEALPPELVRKGRLDEIFFVDLPEAASRQEILSIHLRKRGQDPARFDLARLAAACDGYSGAEIEQAVICAAYEAHARSAALDDATIADEIARTKPLSVVMAERVARLRDWASGRTVPAD
jgi:SpoVK/Ycf46/Vps4 family AAA+-type ATPase